MSSTRDVGDRPRIGCLGLGWIGCHRMKAVADSGDVEIVTLCDPSDEALGQAHEHVPRASCVDSFEAMLDEGIDGVMIATPSAMHSRQAIEALERGVSVFCQKPLARTAAETRRVVEAARRADRLLGVDFSYRHVEAMRQVAELVRSGALGEIFAVDLLFHNAYGPDKEWFYDPERSGGGCVIDLGIHLVDLVFWTLGGADIQSLESHLFHEGKRLEEGQVEDFASVHMELSNGVSARLACSWNLPAGQDAVIEAAFFGTGGGATFRNVNGSFYDFVAERYHGTAREVLVEPPDAWGGRAAMTWAQQLARDPSYDPDIETVIDVAAALDRIYHRL